MNSSEISYLTIFQPPPLPPQAKVCKKYRIALKGLLEEGPMDCSCLLSLCDGPYGSWGYVCLTSAGGPMDYVGMSS